MEMKKMMSEHPDGLYVNVLDTAAYEKSHIPGTVNIPVSSDDFINEVQLKAGGKDRRVVVYCASSDCQASPEAAKKLEAAGFTNVIDFENGLAGWLKAGYKLDRAVTVGAA